MPRPYQLADGRTRYLRPLDSKPVDRRIGGHRSDPRDDMRATERVNGPVPDASGHDSLRGTAPHPQPHILREFLPVCTPWL